MACHGAKTWGIFGIACRGVVWALLVVVSCWLVGWVSGRGGRFWFRSDMDDDFLSCSKMEGVWIFFVLQKTQKITESPEKIPFLKFCGHFV